MSEAVGEHRLPIADGVDAIEASEDRRPSDREQEPVTGRHRTEEDVQPQVLGERLSVWRQLGREVEVTVAVCQEDLHRATRAFTPW